MKDKIDDTKRQNYNAKLNVTENLRSFKQQMRDKI